MPAASIVIEGLTKRYGATVAVDDLSFRVRRGRVTGFLGPNGSGKTTTMRAILGLIEPTRGRALVLGKPYRRLDHPVRHFGALIDGTETHPGMTGRTALRVRAAASGVPDGRVVELLALVGLQAAADRRVGGYSLGMRQRLGLAGALLADPEILVLDEPANGLDPEGVRWIRTFLHRLADDGRTVFVSSHILAEVAKFADEVVVINRGRLVTQAPMAALTLDRRVVVRSPDAALLAHVLEHSGGSVSTLPDRRIVVSGLPVEEVGEIAAREGIALHELRGQESDFESVFLGLTGADAGGEP
jgi:ABC-2 type transport system ATP-binding protein